MKKEVKKTKWKIKNILIALIAILLITSIYLLHTISLFKNIETPLRICVGVLMIDVVAIFCTIGFKIRNIKKLKILTIFAIILLLYSSGITFVATKVKRIYANFATMSNDGSTTNTHSTSIVVTKDSSLKTIEDVKKGTIGLIEEEGNTAVYELPKEIIKKEKFNDKKVILYDNHVELIKDLLDKKIDAAFLPTSYTVMYASDEFETLGDETKIIYTKESTEEIEDKTVQKDLNEPFTMLIMGVDTTGDGIGSSFNGDALLLVTFNPKTMNSTILSIPRDSYIPISCMNGRKNKITNAGWQGESCIMNSIENYFGIKIDYYYKINFNGVVSLVDAIGGVDVEVPYSFCEQNSQRKWGKNTIFVNSGLQHLNGEQALAFARHRKVTSYMRSYCGEQYTQKAGYWNDFARGQHQQLIIKAILNKLADVNSYSTIEKLLDTISNNAKTNMSVDTIFSLYNLGKNILGNSNGKDQILNMQRLYLSGYDAYIYDYSFLHNKGSKLTTYNFIIYDESFKEVVQAMKVNLELEKSNPVKTFSFSIQDKYEPKVIGKGGRYTKTLVQMPNFIGKDISEAKKFAQANNINLVINEVEGSSNQRTGQITKQSIPEKTDISMLDKSRTVTVSVITQLQTQIPVTPKDPEEEKTENEDLTDFILGN